MQVPAMDHSLLASSMVAPVDDRLREITGEVVGSVFLGTLLKSMRESSLKGEYGHGGRGEEIFGAQLHQILTERLGDRLLRDMGDGMYRRLQRPQNAPAVKAGGGNSHD